MPEGYVIVAAVAAGEETVAVRSAFEKGGVGEGFLKGAEEGVARGVEGVFVLWGWIAKGGDEEGAAEHARRCAWRERNGWGV